MRYEERDMGIFTLFPLPGWHLPLSLYFLQKIQFFLTHKVDTENTSSSALFAYLNKTEDNMNVQLASLYLFW